MWKQRLWESYACSSEYFGFPCQSDFTSAPYQYLNRLPPTPHNLVSLDYPLVRVKHFDVAIQIERSSCNLLTQRNLQQT